MMITRVFTVLLVAFFQATTDAIKGQLPQHSRQVQTLLKHDGETGSKNKKSKETPPEEPTSSPSSIAGVSESIAPSAVDATVEETPVEETPGTEPTGATEPSTPEEPTTTEERNPPSACMADFKVHGMIVMAFVVGFVV